MNTNISNILKWAARYGLYLAGVSVLLAILFYLFDFSFFNWMFAIFYGLLAITLYIVFMVMAIKKCRIVYLEGKIKYLQCVLIGVVVILISGYISSLFNFLFYHYFDPEFMKKQFDGFVEKMQNYNLPQEKLDEIIESTSKRIDPTKQFITSLYSVPAMAAILSLIVSIFVRKKDNTFESNFR